jgi:hypothetical protein
MRRSPVADESPPSFTRWLRQQRYREGATADLARFISEPPVYAGDIGPTELKARLRWARAPDALCGAVDVAAREWRAGKATR